jgi:hypothetical protein
MISANKKYSSPGVFDHLRYTMHFENQSKLKKLKKKESGFVSDAKKTLKSIVVPICTVAVAPYQEEDVLFHCTGRELSDVCKGLHFIAA